jgi:hypothetical protein
MLEHRRAKLAVLAAAAVFGSLGGVAVAASTNSLPFAADHGQTTAATRPSSASTAPTPPGTATAASALAAATPAPAAELGASNGNGPDATGPAKFGLCTAWAAGQGSTNGNKADSTAYQALAAAAGGAANVADFCADAIPGGNSPSAGGPSGAQNSQGDEHANPASTEHGPESDPGSQSPRR